MSFTAWRIVQERLANEAFNGEGARLFGGRWNHKGTRMVYTASSLSLATLEILVHLEATHLLSRYVQIPITLEQQQCSTLTARDLPSDWISYPAPVSTKDIGSQWIESASSLALTVPSAIIPSESVYLVNPEHPDFTHLKIGAYSRYDFDARLLG